MSVQSFCGEHEDLLTRIKDFWWRWRIIYFSSSSPQCLPCILMREVHTLSMCRHNNEGYSSDSYDRQYWRHKRKLTVFTYIKLEYSFNQVFNTCVFAKVLPCDEKEMVLFDKQSNKLYINQDKVPSSKFFGITNKKLHICQKKYKSTKRYETETQTQTSTALHLLVVAKHRSKIVKSYAPNDTMRSLKKK